MIKYNKLLSKNIFIILFIFISISILCLCSCQKSTHNAIEKEQLISKLNELGYNTPTETSSKILEIIGGYIPIENKCNDMIYANKNTNDWFMFFICDDNKKASDLWEIISNERNIDNSSYQNVEYEKAGTYNKVILVDNTVLWATSENSFLEINDLNNLINSIGYN